MTEIIWIKRDGIRIQILRVADENSGFVFVAGVASEFVKFNWKD